MSDTIELELHPDGTTRTIYKDEVMEHLKDAGAAIKNIKRASCIEWEQTDCKEGWVVRAAHNPDLAVRVGYDDIDEVSTIMVSDDKTLPVHHFGIRREALMYEEIHFWELLPAKEI